MVEKVIGPHLSRRGFAVSVSKLGGVSKWARMASDIRKLLRNPDLDVLTTIIDYYGLPSSTPGMSDRPSASGFDRVLHVERAVADDIGDRRFVPHLVLHELEAWVFAAGKELGRLRGKPALTRSLLREVDRAGGAEFINDSPQTAPSKRLLRLCPDYNKTSEGPAAIEALGLDALRCACAHLDAWLSALDQYVERG